MQDSHANLNRGLLFFVANLSIFMVGLGFAVRTRIGENIRADLFAPINVDGSGEMIGAALGATFIGFALTLLFGSALVDKLGMKRMLLFAASGFIVGSALVAVAALMPASGATYWAVYGGFLLTGLGWGAVEAASNPLVTALYPEEKTHRLNILHAWWPAGIVAGGLIVLAMGAVGVPWEWNLLVLALPGVLLAVLAMRAVFPVTERVAAGISYRDMFREVLRSPSCFVWFICMMFTATAELAPGSWVEISLSNLIGMPGIVVLIYVSALMFVMRHFAGRIVQHIPPVGLLFWSCLVAGLGLYLLSLANSPTGAFAAATVWGIGVCYLYPTMVASVADRYPRGGAFVMGIMGFSAGVAIQFVLPRMGAIYDSARIEAAGGEAALAQLSDEALLEVTRIASIESFQIVAIVPLLLLPVFGAIWLRDKRRKLESATVTAPASGI